MTTTQGILKFKSNSTGNVVLSTFADVQTKQPRFPVVLFLPVHLTASDFGMLSLFCNSILLFMPLHR